MPDPCGPLHGGVHHRSPAKVIGRIHRHGTARLANRLTAAGGTRPSKSYLEAALLKLWPGLGSLGRMLAS